MPRYLFFEVPSWNQPFDWLLEDSLLTAQED